WQLLAQFISVVTVIAWTFACGAFIWLIMKYTMGIRVHDEAEEMGLDLAIHGIECYPPEPKLVALEEAARGRGKK
ncbi:MAG: hypothetical protein ACE5KK_07235, partial [Candidatus Brocadiales bacterium]